MTHQPADLPRPDVVPPAFAELLASQPGVHDRRIIEVMSTLPRHQLMPRVFVPLGTAQPARRWKLIDFRDEPEQHLAVCYGTEQVVVQLDHRPVGEHEVGKEHAGVPTAMSSGAGLVALALQDVRPDPGQRFLEVGACTGYLAAVAAALTGRQTTGVEIDKSLVREATAQLAGIGADVRLVARDAIRGLPEGRWDAICASFAVRRIPQPWLDHLAPGGRLRTTITTGAPGCHATALVERDENGVLSGTLTAELWGHVPDRHTGWIPMPSTVPDGPGRVRSSVPAPPGVRERGFWVMLSHSLPGVRRFWDRELGGALVLVAGDGSRAVVELDGARATEWGPRNLWAVAEAVHQRWVQAGSPARYGLEFIDGAQRVTGGRGMSWDLPADRSG
ncbi:protein-L-isoaspartate O-methyltransferase family protein [Kitasatospora cineracea]|uniref:protein-L-isoaspartate O-methyltransferase family protein n=1 Tax=Kitasatospora cineracea TaxID=88074 RepID=UPI00340DF431